ncbi:MAG TPA: hypothetical protein EYG03_30335 [Planctomycetes bacterium]|nr:hypothetical protein [Planctomycetota bacterium]
MIKSRSTGSPIGSPAMVRRNTMAMLTIAAAITASATGCSSFLHTSAAIIKSPVSFVSAIRAEKRVVKILCLWEPAEGQGLDGRPSRGFAGQILMFGHGSPSPIPVHGTVSIYEYVNFDPEDVDPQPIHKFTFDDGGWNAHRTESTLGESYNVFLPYVVKNNGHTTCALRVEYTSPDGRVMSSPYTEVTLTAKTSNRPLSALRRNILSDSAARSSDRDRKCARRNSVADLEYEVPTIDSTTIALPRAALR